MIASKIRAPRTDRVSRRVNWQALLATLLGIGILGIEFTFDVQSEKRLYWVAITLDLLLVGGFVAFVGMGAWRSRNNLREWLAKERVNLVLLVLIIPALFAPRFAAAIVIGRALVGVGVGLLYTPLGRRLISNLNLRPSQTLALSFVGVIAVGSLLLMFPAATNDGKGASLLDAIFTITSAACVVGLTVVDTGSYFSFFGQGVILATVQIGGLGIMVMSASFAVMMGGRLRTRTQTGLGEIFDVSSPEGVKNLIKAVALSTVIAEVLGAFLLFWGFGSRVPEMSDRIWWSFFHAICAFCNAGFSLAHDSMTWWASDLYVCGVIIALVTVGGIGFFVIADLTNPAVWEVKNVVAVWRRLQIQTKVALIATVVLNTVGLLLFLFLEYEGALKGLSTPAKISASLFQTVATRSAGFNSVPLGALAPATVFFMVIWMFIGANPGSTGGGIKTSTAAVAIMAVRAMLLGREDVEMFGRRIPSAIVNRSLSIILIAVMAIAGFLMVLLATQNFAFERLTFEAVSAFGTVGLTMDLTPDLDNVGRICLILLMFAGRIGPLTLAMAIGERMRSKQYGLPEGRIAVG